MFPSWVAASVALSPAASADGAAWPESTEPQTVNNKQVQIVLFWYRHSNSILHLMRSLLSGSIGLNLHSMIHFIHTHRGPAADGVLSCAQQLSLISAAATKMTFYNCLNGKKYQTKGIFFQAELRNNMLKMLNIEACSLVCLPGTAVKNFTASLWPWKESWAWAMEQYGTNVPAVTLSLLSSP